MGERKYTASKATGLHLRCDSQRFLEMGAGLGLTYIGSSLTYWPLLWSFIRVPYYMWELVKGP